jgi:hypothetical protein
MSVVLELAAFLLLVALAARRWHRVRRQRSIDAEVSPAWLNEHVYERKGDDAQWQ